MAKFERELSSGGIVAKDSGGNVKVLLIRDPYGKWTWPKGKLDKGESPREAASREIGEEAGLKNIELVSKIGQTNYFYKRDSRLIYKTVYLYLFKSASNESLKIQKSEIEEGDWFSEEEALTKVGYRGAKGIIKRALSLFKKRIHFRKKTESA